MNRGLGRRIAEVLLPFALAAACHAADPAKVLRITFMAAETGFDPVKMSDYYSGAVIESIFDPLLTYDYLARPARLVPNAAASLPQIADQGRTYTLKVRKGIYFTPDPAFKGRPRELTAADYAYSIKRFLDPKNRSPYAFLFEGKIVGTRRACRSRRGKPAALTTMPDCRGSKCRTATRCASGSRQPTSTFRTCWRSRSPARSRAK